MSGEEEKPTAEAAEETPVETEGGSKSSIFVGNLSWSTTNESLAEHFQESAQVVSASVFYFGKSGRSKGCAMVNFEDEGGAAEATKQFDGTEFEGRTIFIREDRGRRVREPRATEAGDDDAERKPRRRRNRKGTKRADDEDAPSGDAEEAAPAPPTRTKANPNRVYIGNVSFDTSKDDLVAFMEKAGTIVKSTIPMKLQGTKLRGHALFEYETEEEAKKAIDELHDEELDGRKMLIREDKGKVKRKRKTPRRRKPREEKVEDTTAGGGAEDTTAGAGAEDTSTDL